MSTSGSMTCVIDPTRQWTQLGACPAWCGCLLKPFGTDFERSVLRARRQYIDVFSRPLEHEATGLKLNKLGRVGISWFSIQSRFFLQRHIGLRVYTGRNQLRRPRSQIQCRDPVEHLKYEMDGDFAGVNSDSSSRQISTLLSIVSINWRGITPA